MKKAFLLTILMMVILGLKAQDNPFVDKVPIDTLSIRFPNSNGITHHWLNENKIQLMKNEILTQKLIRTYKRKVSVGYASIALGTGILTYASAFQKVPQWYSTGYNNHVAKQRRNIRQGTALIGLVFVTVGVIRVYKCNKILNRVELVLRPTSGGVTLFF